jgi:hypothetical protein
MTEKDAANDAVARHLLEAIERVRDDVEKVEFWAGAVSGFAQPVPEYTPNEASVWLPTEQASTLRSKLEPDSQEAESDPREAKPLREPKSSRSKSGNNGRSSRSKPPAGPRS